MSDACCICRRSRSEIPGELVRAFGLWWCRDRHDCHAVAVPAWREEADLEYLRRLVGAPND